MADTTTTTALDKLLARPALEWLATAHVPLIVLGFCALLTRLLGACAEKAYRVTTAAGQGPLRDPIPTASTRSCSSRTGTDTINEDSREQPTE